MSVWEARGFEEIGFFFGKFGYWNYLQIDGQRSDTDMKLDEG
jgi:hypothetical protein